MTGALQRETGHPHVQGLASGCCACVGEGVQTDVHERVGCKVICGGRHERQKVDALFLNPAPPAPLAHICLVSDVPLTFHHLSRVIELGCRAFRTVPDEQISCIDHCHVCKAIIAAT